MEDLSLHILDIAENSIEAQARNISIKIEENRDRDLLILEIVDDGKGMNEETLKKALDPFFTTKKRRRFGLGLSMLQEAARMANGDFTINSKPEQGTRLKATFQASHIDTKPLGDIGQTLAALITAHPEIDFYYSHKCNHNTFVLDTKEIKSRLNSAPINSPEIIKLIKKNIKEGLDNIRRKK